MCCTYPPPCILLDLVTLPWLGYLTFQVAFNRRRIRERPVVISLSRSECGAECLNPPWHVPRDLPRPRPPKYSMGPFSDPAGPECGFQRGRERLSKKKQDVRLGTRLTNPSFYSRNENIQRRTDLQSYLGLDRHEVSNKITIWSRFWLFGCKTSAEFIQVQGLEKSRKGIRCNCIILPAC